MPRRVERETRVFIPFLVQFLLAISPKFFKPLEQKCLPKTDEALRESASFYDSENPNWNALSIAQRASRDWLPLIHGLTNKQKRSALKTTLEKSFRPDFIHFIKESLLIEPTTYFSQQITAEGLIGDGYDEDLAKVMGTNFIQYLTKTGKITQRAEVEKINMIRIQQWAVENVNQKNKYLLWTSPPGLKNEGYEGCTCLEQKNWRIQETHHSFFYLMWATQEENQETITLHTLQIRAWPNIEELINIAEALGSPINTTLSQDHVVNVLISNLVELNYSDLEPKKVMRVVKDIINDHIQNSFFSWKDRPKLDELQFWQKADELFAEFYTTITADLLLKIPQGLSSSDSFWSSPEWLLILKQLDSAWTIFHHLLGQIVLQLNTNSNFLQNINQSWKLKRKLAKLKKQKIDDELAFQLHAVNLKKNKTSNRKTKWFNNNIGFQLNEVNGIFGKIQCAAGTLLKPINQIPTTGITTRAELAGFIGKTRAEKWTMGKCRVCDKRRWIGEGGMCLNCEARYDENNIKNIPQPEKSITKSNVVQPQAFPEKNNRKAIGLGKFVAGLI